MLTHEKLDVYQCSMDLFSVTNKILNRLDRADLVFKDQLRRSSLSVPLNIAESCGKTGIADRARFLSIARGSAMECAACLDCLAILDQRFEEEILQGKTLVTRIVSMLSKMCRPT